MNTTQHFDEMIGAWTNLQKQFWANPLLDMWLPSHAKPQNRLDDLQHQCQLPFEISRNACQELLLAQQKLLNNTLKIGETDLVDGEILNAYFDAMQEMLSIGFEAEKALMEHGFNSLEGLDFTASFRPNLPGMTNLDPVNVWNQNLQSMMQAWQDVAQKAMDAQQKPTRQKARQKATSNTLRQREDKQEKTSNENTMAEQQAA